MVVDKEGHERELSRIELLNKQSMHQFVEETKMQSQLVMDQRETELIAKNQRKKEKIRRLRRIGTTFEIRKMLFKWKMTITIMRYIEQLEKNYLDKESFHTFIIQDIKRIFHGPEVLRLQNSIQLYKDRLGEQNMYMQDTLQDNFTLRVKVNELLAERQTNLARIDRLLVDHDNSMYQNDMLEKAKYNAIEERQVYENRLTEVMHQFEKAIEMKEDLELKYGLRKAIDDEPVLKKKSKRAQVLALRQLQAK